MTTIIIVFGIVSNVALVAACVWLWWKSRDDGKREKDEATRGREK